MIGVARFDKTGNARFGEVPYVLNAPYARKISISLTLTRLDIEDASSRHPRHGVYDLLQMNETGYRSKTRHSFFTGNR